MNQCFRNFFHFALLIAPFLWTDIACSDTFPSKPIRLVVPYGPGGVGDLSARIVAQKMSETLSQPIVIDNRPGAGLIPGTDLLAKSEPDGYTLGIVGNGQTLGNTLFRNLPFDITKDFTHVSTIGFFDIAIVVNSSSNINSVQDLINLANRNPGQLNAGSINIGSTQNLAAELFKSTVKADFTIVPFKSSGEVISAVIGKNIDFGVEILTPLLGPLKGNSLKPIVLMGKKRFPALPNVPTMSESGFPGFEASSWNGISASARTPKDVIEKLNKAVLYALNNNEVRVKLLDLGIEPKGSSSEEMKDLISSDVKKWKVIIENAKIEKQ
jgi:tripartite-type tricarboxylate transporter receptor subunit TctC